MSSSTLLIVAACLMTMVVCAAVTHQIYIKGSAARCRWCHRHAKECFSKPCVARLSHGWWVYSFWCGLLPTTLALSLFFSWLL